MIHWKPFFRNPHRHDVAVGEGFFVLWAYPIEDVAAISLGLIEHPAMPHESSISAVRARGEGWYYCGRRVAAGEVAL
jgi:hypothetical protein